MTSKVRHEPRVSIFYAVSEIYEPLTVAARAKQVVQRSRELLRITALGGVAKRAVPHPLPQHRVAVEASDLVSELLGRATNEHRLAVNEAELARGQLGYDGGDAAAHRFNELEWDAGGELVRYDEDPVTIVLGLQVGYEAGELHGPGGAPLQTFARVEDRTRFLLAFEPDIFVRGGKSHGWGSGPTPLHGPKPVDRWELPGRGEHHLVRDEALDSLEARAAPFRSSSLACSRMSPSMSG